ncbi:Zinc finger A20 and AN1 domain-containing stress-associated protein 1 [Acorus calamus]|uniref:Zinc finger A20 and AN1 domain-containing stress-associated protein 1 n=1 Tax=Acorus calamus TaxID=4465 RepID=A0AAV9CHV1_ACOCL|nr:Zinc finger A20 and AN1 domain-containing stress-associated protein 1 [Acorus calamus]
MAEEEHRCQAPRLCENNCGFFGSPATMNLCSRCYRDHQSKEERASSAKIAVERSLLGSSSEQPLRYTSAADPSPSVADPTPTVEASASSTAGRCGMCRRKVGLTGFRCRCGMTYCGAHRYPEQHTCGFDFKKVGREAIARANPVVKADKVDRI